MTDPNGHSADIGGTEHLSEAEVAGYVDHDVTPDERRRVESHIDQCASCRSEVIALSRIVHPEATARGSGIGRRRRWWLPAAAAVVLVGIALPRLTTNSSRRDTVQRSPRITEAGGGSQLAAVTPEDDTTVRGGPITFAWHATSADVYRMTVTTETGDPVWSKDSGDTSVVLPDSVPLQPGRAYFWSVEAIGNGITAKTGVRRLQIAR